MRRNMSGNFGLYKYLWPGSVYVAGEIESHFRLGEIESQFGLGEIE